MSNTNKRLSILTFTLLFIGVNMGIVTFQSFQSSKLTLHDELPQILENAVRQIIKISFKHTPIYIHHSSDPELLGTFEERNLIREDTTIVYMHKKVDIETEIYNVHQRYLLSTDSMYCQNIQLTLDSLLSEKNIHAKSIVGITSTGLYYDPNRLSEDTTKFKIDERIAYIVDTSLKKITYTAYMDYSLYTYWKLMPTAKVYILLLLTILLAGSIAWFIIPLKKKTIVPETIKGQEPSTLLDESSPTEQLLLEDGYIIFDGNKEKIQPQSISILQMFLNSSDLRVLKSVIKDEHWNGNYDKTNLMANAINKINNLFSKIDYPYRIITKKESRPFYSLLSLHAIEEETQKNNVGDAFGDVEE